VFGAQAVIAYGVPRLSADVDVTVKLEPDDPQRFASAMQAAGFVLRVDDPEFIRRTRVMPFVHSATGLRHNHSAHLGSSRPGAKGAKAPHTTPEPRIKQVPHRIAEHVQTVNGYRQTKTRPDLADNVTALGVADLGPASAALQ
jgi:hypothetical protein